MTDISRYHQQILQTSRALLVQPAVTSFAGPWYAEPTCRFRQSKSHCQKGKFLALREVIVPFRALRLVFSAIYVLSPVMLGEIQCKAEPARTSSTVHNPRPWTSHQSYIGRCCTLAPFVHFIPIRHHRVSVHSSRIGYYSCTSF